MAELQTAMASVLGSADLVGRLFDLSGCGWMGHLCLDARLVCRAQRVSRLWRAAALERLEAARSIEMGDGCEHMLARQCPALSANYVLLRFRGSHSGGGAGASLSLSSLSLSGGRVAASDVLDQLSRARARAPRAPASLRALGILGAPLEPSCSAVEHFLLDSCRQLRALDLSHCSAHRVAAPPRLAAGAPPPPISAHGRIFRALHSSCRASLRTLTLSGPPAVCLSRSDLDTLSRLRLISLRLHRCVLEPGGVCGLLAPGCALVGHLTQLDVGFCSLSVDDIEEILFQIGHQLTKLSLADAPLRPLSFARAAAGMALLRELDMSHTDVLGSAQGDAAGHRAGHGGVARPPSGLASGASGLAANHRQQRPAARVGAGCQTGADNAEPLLQVLASLPSLRRLTLLQCSWLTHDGVRVLSRGGSGAPALTHDVPPPPPPRVAVRSSPPPESWESFADDDAPRLPELEPDPAPRLRLGGGRPVGEAGLIYTGTGVMPRPVSIYHVSQGDEPLYGNARPRASAFDGRGLLRS
jgi:hypothetical protein